MRSYIRLPPRNSPAVLSVPTKPKWQAALKDSEKLLEEKQRRISEYIDNYTCALALPKSTPELEAIKDNSQELLNFVKNYIVEHAARRMDLFFYTLVAYFKTFHTPIQAETKLQHGRGRKTSTKTGLTQACHSSLFPGFIDQTIYDQMGQYNPAKKNFMIYKSILCATHFMDSLNSTLELPIFVNNLDCELEGRIEVPSHCREVSLQIIQDVAQGILNPLQGLYKFFRIMEQTFRELAAQKIMKTNQDPYLSRNSLYSPKHIKEELLELEKLGSFGQKWSTENHAINSEYIELLLRLTPMEKSICRQNNTLREKIYLLKIDEIQNEILTTRSGYSY